MTDRDRLIELLENCEHISYLDSVYDLPNIYNLVADHLLANGVIVPPCKVGDKLYRMNRIGKLVECVEYTVKNINCTILTERPYNCFAISNVGTCLFLTKEEAEQALKNRGKEDEGK